MSAQLQSYDITQKTDFQKPLDFNQRSQLQHTDKTYRAEISSVIRLTEMEKLFHLRIIDDAERQRFSFLPGQFLMLEVPGFGEVPISISSSTSAAGCRPFTHTASVATTSGSSPWPASRST